MSKNIITLGGGMVGFAIAKDLKEQNYSVTVADRDESLKTRLAPFGISFLNLDFSNYNSVSDAVKKYDFVIGAVPGFMGFDILKAVLDEKKNMVDISFMPEDSRELNQLAEKNGVTVITDAGVAPGLSNLLFGRALSEFDNLHSANCYVGGLPQNPQPPWWYKSVFSPIDVIEEYTRPARFVNNGKLITKPAMTDIEQLEFDGVGKLDAFNSDGLRSLLDLPIPNMVEKTLRYPGHIQKIIEMRDNGLFEPDKIKQTAESLIENWDPGKEDYDQTIMRLEFSGIKDGKEITETFDLLDFYDKKKNISSMARTTGYTCTAVANLVLSDTFSQSGIFNLEKIKPVVKLADYILHYLSQRNIQFNN
ncbi:MAG: saccharopine dehydrogenase NADP-binding domain-containing protein [Candidatus Marinimicrobia bacterium]|nr:saccharopine dehydrogenase NADP-binding domain-containing protein [Candidatus Neomarinimicrobiota bacterium]